MRRLFDYAQVPRRQRSLILAAMLFWSVIAFFFFHDLVFQLPTVVGPSMRPTLLAGERHILWLLPYRFRNPRRGEIVAVRAPDDQALMVKRVIALPGEIVQIKKNRVYINDQALAEPYLKPLTETSPGRIGARRYQVETNCYFVLGDNRPDSFDSRYIGAVRRQWIIGRIQ